MFPIHHIGIAVTTIDQGLKLYKAAFGFESFGREVLADRAIELVFVKTPNVLIELLAPTKKEGVIHQFIEKKGPGLHHLCYEVPDVNKALAKFKADGYELIDQKARPGAKGHLIGFLHPKGFEGVLVELCAPLSTT